MASVAVHAAVETRVNTDPIRRAAELRANDDCARGLADLDHKIVTAPEYEISGDATGKRMIVSTRASLVGMRDHLRASIERQKARE